MIFNTFKSIVNIRERVIVVSLTLRMTTIPPDRCRPRLYNIHNRRKKGSKRKKRRTHTPVNRPFFDSQISQITSNNSTTNSTFNNSKFDTIKNVPNDYYLKETNFVNNETPCLKGPK